MEGYLYKNEGIIFGWVKYYFILHEDTVMYQDSDRKKIQGSFHLKVAKLNKSSRDPLQICINNGTSNIELKATSIKDKVAWTNALVAAQQACFQAQDSAKKGEGLLFDRDDGSNGSPSGKLDDSQDLSQQLNMAFVTKIFKPESPFFTNLGRIWELEAEFEEIVSLLVPEAKKSKSTPLVEFSENLVELAQQMKYQITQCVYEMEDARKEMFRVSKNMLKLKTSILHKSEEEGNEYLNGQSLAKLNSQNGKGLPRRNAEGASSSVAYQSPPRLRDKSMGPVDCMENGSPGDNGVQLANQKKLALNSELFEEIKEEPKGLTLSELKGNERMGFGGIPVTYNLKMRDQLPVLCPENQNFGLWEILKTAIGKDLTKITMPIILNEPFSMLQKSAEILQHIDMVPQIVNARDDFKRIGLIAVWTLSQYHSLDYRTKKPFNPLLGETYEVVQPEYRFVAEQVCHHPPITAFHLEGEGWNCYGNTNVKNNFWGSSVEVKIVGKQHFVLASTGEHFIIQRPDNSANNIIVGKMYIDVHGTLEVINVTKGHKAMLNIHRQGWTQKNSHRVEGKVTDGNGLVKYEVNGTWNKELRMKSCVSGEEEVVWRGDPLPPNGMRQYGMFHFSLNLNYVDADMLKTLPPTDCRRRPDQRLLEELRIDEGAKEKHRLEEKQRAVRKMREQSHVPYKPRWFQETVEEIGEKERAFLFTGEYWERRKKLDYNDFLDLF